jgi:hypothetical protein
MSKGIGAEKGLREQVQEGTKVCASSVG